MKLKIIIVLTIIACIILGVVVATRQISGTDLAQERLLREEINTLNEKDPLTDDYNTEIKTTGTYAEIEKAVKGYLSDYATYTKETNAIMEELQQTPFLNNENYQKDGPEFVESFQKITELREKFNTAIDTLIYLHTQEGIEQKEKQKNWNRYYKNLYAEFMIEKDTESMQMLEDTKKQLETAKQDVNDTLDKQYAVLSYLKENKTKWQISDAGRLEFFDQETLDGYSALAVNPEETGDS